MQSAFECSKIDARRIDGLLREADPSARNKGIWLANDFIRDAFPEAGKLLQPLLACALYDSDVRNRIDGARVYHLCTGDFASTIGALNHLAEVCRDPETLATLADVYVHNVLIGTGEVVQGLLVRLIEDGDASQCCSAADVLSRLWKDENLVGQAVKQRLAKENDTMAVWKLLDLLQSMRGQIQLCLVELSRLSEHQDQSLRAFVCDVLSESGGQPEVLEILIQRLWDGSDNVRLAAEIALVKNGMFSDAVIARLNKEWHRLPDDVRSWFAECRARWLRLEAIA